MKRIFIGLSIIIFLAALVSCTSPANKVKMNYYHGAVPPDFYVSVIQHTPEEITFQIRVSFGQKHLYHLVLDGNNPISEDWFPTIRTNTHSYTVTMKPKKGFLFETGKTYRLCIGEENPELIAVHSSNYRCLVDYEFVLTQK